METDKKGYFLTLTECAEEIGMTRAGIYKKLKRECFPIEKDESGEIQVNASMFHGKYVEEIARHKGSVSGNVSKNDNGNNGKQQELELRDKEIEGLRAQLFERDQRISEKERLQAEVVEGLKRENRLLTDMRGQLPPDVIEKIAALEAENRLLKEAATARQKSLDEAKARREQEAAERAARPFWKKIIG